MGARGPGHSPGAGDRRGMKPSLQRLLRAAPLLLLTPFLLAVRSVLLYQPSVNRSERAPN